MDFIVDRPQFDPNMLKRGDAVQVRFKKGEREMFANALVKRCLPLEVTVIVLDNNAKCLEVIYNVEQVTSGEVRFYLMGVKENTGGKS